jgi:hypothetical protein
MLKVRPRLKAPAGPQAPPSIIAWIALDGEATDCECSVADVSQSGAKISGNITAEVGSQLGITPVPRSALVQSFGAHYVRLDAASILIRFCMATDIVDAA